MAATEINVLAELERCGITFEWAGEEEVKCACPFHQDDNPSCHISITKRMFRCYTAGCGAKGDIISFMARLLNTTRHIVHADLSSRYDLSASKIIDPATIEKYHARIWKAGPLLTELHKRGVTDELIRKYRWGESKGRVTIPIMNEGGLFVNVRMYLPGAPGPKKMRNTKGRGHMRLYPYTQLKYEEIVLCGGEAKAIVAAEALNKFGVGAITATGGEGNWDPELTPKFRGKRVHVCFDIDPEGQEAAQQRCAMLHSIASWVGNLVLPLDPDKHPHGDVNDFIATEKGDLQALLKDVVVWRPTRLAGVNGEEEAEAVGLQQATNAEYAGKRVALTAVVSSMDTAPYVIPKQVKVNCDESHTECYMCPVFLDKQRVQTVAPESAAILGMMNAPKDRQRPAIMEGILIPPSCKVCEFEIQSYYNIEDARISPQLEITTRSVERVMQPAMCIGGGVELNESYVLTGRMWPHPKTQQATLLISKYDTAKDALSTFQVGELEPLELFNPAEWTVQGVRDKLNSLYEDFESNVTRIYKRRAIHLTADLAYHSPLHVPFDGKVEKGWVEVLICGDSAQGKSEVVCGSSGPGGLMAHYGLGEKVECKNASVAGLLGGCAQTGSRWFITWGIIPTHDKRLVILEELKGASTDVIGKLTDMRSSGIAEIPKIEKRRTYARCRLIAVSNPRGDLQLGSHNFGVEAIKHLIGNPEDIRRFDMCLLLARGEVSAEELNQLQTSRPHIPHVHESVICRKLILWGWTRTADQVSFDKDAQEAVLELSTSLCADFTDAIPIVDRGSMRLKLARLSASLACRTFSHDGENLRVRKCHVEFIADFLKKTYGSPVFGYSEFTAATKLFGELLDPDAIQKRIEATPFPGDLTKSLLHTAEIDLQDLQDWTGWDRQEANSLLSFLVRKRAFLRESRCYRKTPQFIGLLKHILNSGTLIDRPAFLEEQF